MKSAFVCWNCKKVIADPWDQLEVRTEYRRISDYARYAVIKTKELCRKCVDEQVDLARNGTPQGEQGALL